jgi:hypothetical protein
MLSAGWIEPCIIKSAQALIYLRKVMKNTSTKRLSELYKEIETIISTAQKLNALETKNLILFKN